MDLEIRVTKVEINYFVDPFVVVLSVVMSSDSDDSVSLSGSESDLNIDDIFEDEDGNFEGFVNNDIPAGRNPLITTVIIIVNLMRQMLAGSSRNNGY